MMMMRRRAAAVAAGPLEATAAALYGSGLRRSEIGIPLFPATSIMRSTPSTIRSLSVFTASAITTPQKASSSTPPLPPRRGSRLIPACVLRSLPKSKTGWVGFFVTAIFAGYGLHAFWRARDEFIPFTDVPYSLLPAPHLEHLLGNKAVERVMTRWRRRDISMVSPGDPTDSEAARLKKIGSRLVGALEEHVWEGSDELRRARLRSEQLVKSTRWLLEVARTQRGIVSVDMDMDLALELTLELELELEQSMEVSKDLAERHLQPSFSLGKRSKALEGLCWDVILVRHMPENAFSLYVRKVRDVLGIDEMSFSLYGGNTIIFYDMLHVLKTDEELAFIIGHEVAHSLCRHTLVRSIIDMIFGWSYAVWGLLTLVPFLDLPFSERDKFLADRVALLMSAKAGYDPRKSILAIEKLGLAFDTRERTKGRVQMLISQTMDEAVLLFEEAKGSQWRLSALLRKRPQKCVVENEPSFVEGQRNSTKIQRHMECH